jgi:hypothetical protein
MPDSPRAVSARGLLTELHAPGFGARAPIGMPASRWWIDRAITHIGKCSSTPATTAKVPSQNAGALPTCPTSSCEVGAATIQKISQGNTPTWWLPCPLAFGDHSDGAEGRRNEVFIGVCRHLIDVRGRH